MSTAARQLFRTRNALTCFAFHSPNIGCMLNNVADMDSGGSTFFQRADPQLPLEDRIALPEGDVESQLDHRVVQSVMLVVGLT